MFVRFGVIVLVMRIRGGAMRLRGVIMLTGRLVVCVLWHCFSFMISGSASGEARKQKPRAATNVPAMAASFAICGTEDEGTRECHAALTNPDRADRCHAPVPIVHAAKLGGDPGGKVVSPLVV
jgi:hypothetical protein